MKLPPSNSTGNLRARLAALASRAVAAEHGDAAASELLATLARDEQRRAELARHARLRPGSGGTARGPERAPTCTPGRGIDEGGQGDRNLSGEKGSGPVEPTDEQHDGRGAGAENDQPEDQDPDRVLAHPRKGDGSSTARHRRRHAAQLRRIGRCTGPAPVDLPWHAGSQARAILEGSPERVATFLRTVPRELARGIRNAAAQTCDRRTGRRVVALAALLIVASEPSSKRGRWRVVHGLCREALAVVYPRHVEHRGRSAHRDATGRPIYHPNTISRWAAHLEAAGVLEIVQPGGPDAAGLAPWHCGPTGWALNQYRLVLPAGGDPPPGNSRGEPSGTPLTTECGSRQSITARGASPPIAGVAGAAGDGTQGG